MVETKRQARLETLDAWRGLALVVMTVNHLSHNTLISWQPLGFVSFAEVFVFVSGLVAGIVYGRLHEEGQNINTRAFKRAAEIYLYYVAGTALHRLIAFLGGSSNEVPPLNDFLLSLLFVDPLPYFDILVIYIVFLMVLPTLQKAVSRGWSLRLIIGSVGLWVLAQLLNPQEMLQQFFGKQLIFSFFNICAWQLLFVAGLVIGNKYKEGLRPQFPAYFPVVTVALALLFFVIRYELLPGMPPLPEWMYDHDNLGPLNVANFTILALLVFWSAQENRFSLKSGSLEFLGRNSLEVFTYHCILVAFSYAAINPSKEIFGALGIPIFYLAAVISLFAAAQISVVVKEQFR